MIDYLNILIIEEVSETFSASFVGNSEDLKKDFVLLKYPTNETVELLRNLIQFHSEVNGSICEELEKIMSLILNEGIKIGKGDKTMVNMSNVEESTDSSMNQEEKDKKKIIDLLTETDPDSVTASRLKSLEYEIKKLVNQFRDTYGGQFPIERDKCNHPDFADIDCECYNYCELCGENCDR